jgi:hypothetical protein
LAEVGLRWLMLANAETFLTSANMSKL